MQLRGIVRELGAFDRGLSSLFCVVKEGEEDKGGKKRGKKRTKMEGEVSFMIIEASWIRGIRPYRFGFCGERFIVFRLLGVLIYNCRCNARI